MSKLSVKEKAFLIAEIIDVLRILPRVLLAVYGSFAIYYIAWVVEWFMLLPPAERTVEVMGFVTGSITVVLGGLSWYSGTYTKGGRDWKTDNTKN